MSLNESTVEAALTWFKEMGYAIGHGLGRTSPPVNWRRSGIRLATWCW
ncbi:MAG: hypothetical protein IT578_06420 [Verrucomicrobiae bacterium]|nr:hypothetical protein [Verrucomicrobiae bacterium]